MRSSFALWSVCALFALAGTACLFAQDFSTPAEKGGYLAVEFPHDSPVLPVSFSLGPTTFRPRGVSMALELHASLLLRNTGNKPISGLTLQVDAQDLTPAGKGSVTVPSLDVLPGQVFPVRIDMELLRPFNVAKSDRALVQVSLDCALFTDFSSYGPDKLNSRRALMVYELEARRDRHYLAKLVEAGKWAELRQELNFGIEDLNPQQLGLELLRGARTPVSRAHSVSVGAVTFPNAPVQPLSGAAHVLGNEVGQPEVEVKNTSQKMVRSIEMGWIVRDERGRDFVAGSMPAPLQLRPVQTGTMTEPATLRFSHPSGQPMQIGGLMAYVNDVEFADGQLWIPSRADINGATSDPVLRHALATSPEQQRLEDIYRRKGISGLEEELRKTQ